MNLNSHITQHLQKLAPPTTRNLAVERDLRVPMRDGAVLLADRWTPAPAGPHARFQQELIAAWGDSAHAGRTSPVS